MIAECREVHLEFVAELVEEFGRVHLIHVEVIRQTGRKADAIRRRARLFRDPIDHALFECSHG